MRGGDAGIVAAESFLPRETFPYKQPSLNEGGAGLIVRVGTSGWSYDHWEDVLYPPGAPARERLGYYVRRFDTVELNSSFYRWPNPVVGHGKWLTLFELSGSHRAFVDGRQPRCKHTGGSSSATGSAR